MLPYPQCMPLQACCVTKDGNTPTLTCNAIAGFGNAALAVCRAMRRSALPHMQAHAAGLGFTPGLGSSAGLGSTAGLGSRPGLGGDATPALGSDYGSETPFVGGLGLGATPSVQSGQPPEEAKQVGEQLWVIALHAIFIGSIMS